MIETDQPGSTWHLLVRFSEIGELKSSVGEEWFAGALTGISSFALVISSWMNAELGRGITARPHLVILAHPDLLIHTSPK